MERTDEGVGGRGAGVVEDHGLANWDPPLFTISFCNVTDFAVATL
jgi:hypothetical protein